MSCAPILGFRTWCTASASHRRSTSTRSTRAPPTRRRRCRRRFFTMLGVVGPERGLADKVLEKDHDLPTDTGPICGPTRSVRCCRRFINRASSRFQRRTGLDYTSLEESAKLAEMQGPTCRPSHNEKYETAGQMSRDPLRPRNCPEQPNPAPRPHWERKTAFPENDRTTLLKPTKVLSPWHHSALVFTDWRKLDDEIG